ncbi:MAG: hypothetical protein HQK52_10850 [Oligoflexia bacterium]|nr:hypothetical protein [Oligoflexia bacterium]
MEQQMCSSLSPSHLLLFHEALADHLIRLAIRYLKDGKIPAYTRKTPSRPNLLIGFMADCNRASGNEKSNVESNNKHFKNLFYKVLAYE